MAFWRLSVLLNDVDVTALAVGDLSISRTETAAATVEVTLLLDALIPDVTHIPGYPISVRYSDGVDLDWTTLFTGRVASLSVDLSADTATLSCSDMLQNIFEGVPPEGVLLAVGAGHWNSILFQRTRNGLDAFADIMSTLTEEYSLSRAGDARRVSWNAKAVPDYLFNESGIGADEFGKAVDGAFLDSSLSFTLGNSREVVNAVEVKFDYRFTRLYQYDHALSWTYGDAFSQYFLFLNPPGHQQIAQAVTGAGWAVNMIRGPKKEPATAPNAPWIPAVVTESGASISAALPLMVFEPAIYEQAYVWNVTEVAMYPVPGAGPRANPAPASPGASVVNTIGYSSDNPRFSAVNGFGIGVKKRFTAELTESRIALLTAEESISRLGVSAQTVNHAVSCNYAGDRTTSLWEEMKTETVQYVVADSSGNNRWGPPESAATSGNSFLTDVPLTFNRYVVNEPDYPPDYVGSGSAGYNGYPSASGWNRDRSAVDGRERFNEAYAAAHARALRVIVESHRHNYVKFDTPVMPLLDLEHTVKVMANTPDDPNANAGLRMLKAKGKVYALTHVLSPESGRAVTTVTLALILPYADGSGVSGLPSFDLPFTLRWDENPPPHPWPSSFLYGLDVWPPDSPWDTTKYNIPAPAGFRGYNALTGDFVIESPTPPPPAHLNNLTVRTDKVAVKLPVDLLVVGGANG